MALPTIQQGIPYFYVIGIDQNGNIITSTNPSSVNIAQMGGVPTQMGNTDNVAQNNIPAYGTYLFNGSNVWERWKDVSGLGDGTVFGMAGVGNFAWNGATWDEQRTPTIFKTATATTSGNNDVWTPATNKRFRLMAFLIDVTANAAISGGGAILEIVLQDSTTPIGLGFSLWVPTVTVTTMQGGYTSGWCLLGNGVKSVAQNNALNANLSATLTSGEVRINAIGTEEV